MRFEEIMAKYPEKFIIIVPAYESQGRPITYKVLQTCATKEACEKAMEYYDLEGFDKVVPVPNFTDDAEDLDPKYIARLFRVVRKG